MYELVALIAIGLGFYSLGKAAGDRGTLFFLVAALVFFLGGGLHLYNAQEVGTEMLQTQERWKNLFE